MKTRPHQSLLAGDDAIGGALSGNGSTFLTGPSGIDPSTLSLGRNRLLGE